MRKQRTDAGRASSGAGSGSRVATARWAVALLAALVLLALASPAAAQDSPPKFRIGKYGRGGAEVWGEVPRFTLPTGKGYAGDYDITNGVGFGFGLMLGFSDKLAVEGRMCQTNHETPDERNWDVDQYYLGIRYTFRHERAWQPFVAAGGARISLEWNEPEGGITDFTRLWGLGAYGTVGIDYVISNRWAVGVRTDYVWSKYTRANVGTEENDLEDSFDSSSIGISLSLHYRVPVYW